MTICNAVFQACTSTSFALAQLSVCILLSVVSSPIISLHPSPMQVGSVEVPVSAEGLFPAVGMHSMGEEVKVDLQAEWFLEEDDSMMMVDSHEDDWGRLYDVRVSGTVRSRIGPSLLLGTEIHCVQCRA